MTTMTEKIADLLDAAQAEQDHLALGYASWTAYVAGEFADALAGLSTAARRPAVFALAEGGLSTRAIAEIAGVDQSTVVRDRQVMRFASPEDRCPKVIGRDGKSYDADRPTAPDDGRLPDVDAEGVPTEAAIGEMFVQRIEEGFADDPKIWQAAHDIAPVIRVLWPWPTHPQHVALRTVSYEIFIRCPPASPVWDVMNIWLYHVAAVALREYEDLDEKLSDTDQPGRDLAKLCRVVCNPDLDVETQVMLHKQLENNLSFAVFDCERWLFPDQIARCRAAVGMAGDELVSPRCAFRAGGAR